MSNSSVKEISLEERLENWLKDEESCHYFAIQIEGKEVYPFGFANRPFYSLDQAKTYLEYLRSKNPDIDYHLYSGAIDVDYIDFENLEVPMWHRVWINHHQARLIRLRMWKKSEQDLFELIQNYDEVIAWQEANNTTEFCHYYLAQSFNDNEIATSSTHTASLREAFIAKMCLEKTMPGRKFKIERGLIHTDSLLSMDGRTADFFQEFIDFHKERIRNLDPEYLVNREIVTETRKVKR